MNKTNVKANPSTTHRHDTPNNKTHIISDRLLQQYGITVKESRGRLSYLPAGRTKFIRARSIGDKFEKELVLAALKANTERKRTIQSKSDRIGKLIDIQAKLKQGKGIGYERWAKKYNLKAMARRTGSGERPRRPHEGQQRAALSCRSLRQHQERRTAVKSCKTTRSL